jgi:hypothetical protein
MATAAHGAVRAHSSRELHMTYSMSHASIAAFETGLSALSAVLEKGEAFAAAKKIDASVLLQMRLAPDMFPLTRQVQIACDLAKNGMARLAGVEAPKFEDNETTIAQLKERIARTISFIKGLDAGKIDASSTREIVFPMGPTKKGAMKGDDYLRFFITPNVYFHMTAAYAILRHAGADVGKMDFLGKIPLTIS